MIFKTAWHIEGLNPDGEWHILDRELGVEGDHLAHRDEVVRVLRRSPLGKRYSKIRLAKYVTTIEVVGEDIIV